MKKCCVSVLSEVKGVIIWRQIYDQEAQMEVVQEPILDMFERISIYSGTVKQ